MNRAHEVREFLLSRRANVTPADVGIPLYDDDRRVPGLMGRALFAPVFEVARPNLARFIFLDSRARGYYADGSPTADKLTVLASWATGH